MIRFTLHRLISGLITIWFAATLAFFLGHSAPGGPAMALGGEHGAPGYLEEVSRVYGLDRPLYLVYFDWLGRVARGDLGMSYRHQLPVIDLIAERAPVTLALMLPAFLSSALLGMGMGLLLARPYVRQSKITALLAGLHAMPSYVIAQILVIVFALGLNWFPVQGFSDPRLQTSGLARLAEMSWRLTLPVMALVLVQLPYVALLTRARVSEELGRPYALTALSKGLSGFSIKFRHALPNASLPVLTLLGWRFAALISGSVIIETVFALPGLGRLAVTSAIARDHPTVIGIVLIACTLVVSVNVLVDLLAYRLDPRIGRARRSIP